MVVGESTRLAGVGLSLIEVEGTLSRCDVRGLLSSCGKELSSNCDGYGSSLVVMLRGLFLVAMYSLVVVVSVFFSCDMVGSILLIARGFCLIVMCGYAPL